jgi:hypothetical protein
MVVADMPFPRPAGLRVSHQIDRQILRHCSWQPAVGAKDGCKPVCCWQAAPFAPFRIFPPARLSG